jgi:hypothetical protein
VGFSEVPRAEERCERLENFLIQDLQFVKRDIHIYSDLSRKNLIKLIDDLAPVLKVASP